MPDDKPPETQTPDLGKLVEAALAKHGDQTSALKAFASDLYAARQDAEKYRAELPPKGSRVLSGDDAKGYEDYRALGNPADVRRTLEEHKALAQKVAAYERDETLRGVAEKAGVKFAVLRTLAPADLAFESKAVKGKDGKEAEAVHVKDGDKLVPFDDYAAAHWPDFLPALKPGANPAPPPRQPGTPPRLDPTHRPAPAAGGNAPRPVDPGARLLAAARSAF